MKTILRLAVAAVMVQVAMPQAPPASASIRGMFADPILVGRLRRHLSK
jgi:hypothetical protein